MTPGEAIGTLQSGHACIPWNGRCKHCAAQADAKRFLEDLVFRYRDLARAAAMMREAIHQCPGQCCGGIEEYDSARAAVEKLDRGTAVADATKPGEKP